MICNIGFPSWEPYAIKDKPENFYMLGLMRLASSIGLDLALSRPNKRVIVLDGDGPVLMNLGHLATIAHCTPENHLLVISDNCCYDSAGNQPLCSNLGTDLAAMAITFINFQGPNEHDRNRFVEVLENIIIGIRRGRPRSRPIEIDADAAYEDRIIRDYLRRRSIKSNIPVNNRNRKTPKRGRPTRFDNESYRKRGCFERFFTWIKTGFRKIAVRYERLDSCFTGLLNFA